MKKTSADDDYLTYYTVRKLSTFLAIFFIKLGIPANFITLFGFLTDLLVIYTMATGNLILAGILVFLAPVLDCSDGEVARYYKSKEKNPKKKHYGGYLDEVLGTISFTLVIFFTGYYLGSLWIGLAAMIGLFMIIISSCTAQIEFKNKEKIAKNLEKKIFGKIKGRIGFSFTLQRTLIALSIIFASLEILLLFAVLANAFWILKFWAYRNQ